MSKYWASHIDAKEAVCIFLLLAVTMLAAHHTMFFSGFADTQGGGDTVLVNYLFEHNWRWLTRQPLDKSLFSPPFFFPQPDTLAYTDLYLGTLPLYSCWRLLGVSPATSFQLWTLTISVLNFGSAYLLLRFFLKCSAWASGIGAAFFAFASPRVLQLGHPGLLTGFYVVAVMAGLWLLFPPTRANSSAKGQGSRRKFRNKQLRLSRRRVWTGALLASGAAVAQFYFAFYYFWFMSFCATVALVYVLLIPSLRGALIALIRVRWGPVLGCLVLSALLLAPGALKYYGVRKQVGIYPYDLIAYFLPTPLSWFAQGPTHWLYGPWNLSLGVDQSYGGGEMYNGIGFLTMALVLVAFVKFRSRPVIAIWGFVSAVVVVATLSWHGYALWQFVYAGFPGGQALRAVSRFGVFLLLSAALALALSVDWLTRRFSPALALACVLVIWVEQAGAYNLAPVYNKRQIQDWADSVSHALRPGCATYLFSGTAGSTSEQWMQLIGMWAELSAGIPTLNGYSGHWAPDWPFINAGISNRLDRVRLYEGIRDWVLRHPQINNVCWVTPGVAPADVIHREDLNRDAFTLRRTYLALLGRLPKESELNSQARPGALVEAVMTSPEFRDRERFVFAGYRSLYTRDPAFPIWLAAMEDLVAHRKSRAQLIEEWQQSEQCRTSKACSGVAPEEVIRRVSGALSPEEQEHDSRVLLYYCLLQRAPTASDQSAGPDWLGLLLRQSVRN